MFAHRDLVDTFTSFKSKNDFTGAVIGQLKRNHIAESLVRINAAVTVYVGKWQLVEILFLLRTSAETEIIRKLLFDATVAIKTNTQCVSISGMQLFIKLIERREVAGIKNVVELAMLLLVWRNEMASR